MEGAGNSYKLNLNKFELMKAYLPGMPERKTVLKGAFAIAIAAVAATAIYNREAIGAFAKKQWTEIKDFANGNYNHIFGGAQAGDAATSAGGIASGGSSKPQNFSMGANGSWGWQ